MQKTKFIFCVHNHQPVGNFDHVLEDSFNKSYKPFIDVLLKYPSIKFVLHFSGILLEWLDKNKPDYLKKIRDLVSEGRVEIISSGIYEPVLASLPEADRIGQVLAFNKMIKELTGYEPKGAWLTERIYEPQLPKSLNQAGIDYIIVDDYHFIKAGLEPEDLNGYYITEEEGHPLKIFAGSERLRYLIPFQDPNETLEHFKHIAHNGKGNLVLLADDGEKFGSWPETYSWVYEQHWLDNFCKMLEYNNEIVETVTFSEYIKENRALGRVYLPTCSYMEMGKWTLPAGPQVQFEDAERFLNDSGRHEFKRFMMGGTWRNFIAKYEESNNIHKKMLYVSEKVHNHFSFDKESASVPDYLDELYKGQCNDAYWHGVFGGLYLPHLRDALYRHLINAEILLDKATGRQTPFIDIITRDINLDGYDEIIVEADDYNLYISPHTGGTIYEYDHKPALFNIMNTLTRRKEAYHNKIMDAKCDDAACETKTIHEIVQSKEEGLDRYLHFDTNQKVSLVDHFFDSMSVEDFRKSSYSELGDFAGKEYDHAIIADEKSPAVELKRVSFVKPNGDAEKAVELKKVITFNKGKRDIEIDYSIKNLSNDALTTNFGVEFNIMLLSPDDENRFYNVPSHTLPEANLASEGEISDVGEIRMVDRYLNFDVCFEFPSKCNFYRAPVETVSISEGGFERIFQSSSMLFFKMLNLKRNDEFNFRIKYRVENS